MAMIECKYCGHSISDRANRCPKCNRNVHKAKSIAIIIVAMLLLTICGGGYAIHNRIKEKNRLESERIEADRQAHIAETIEQIERLYLLADFDAIEEKLDYLDILQYDTVEMREVLTYDREVYPKCIEYLQSQNNTYNELINRSYRSITSTLRGFKSQTEAFKKIEINSKSIIGEWINTYRASVEFTAFDSVMLSEEYLNAIEDNYYTDWIHADAISVAMKELMQERYKFPIRIDIDRNSFNNGMEQEL